MIPPMLIKRTHEYKSPYKKTKTLNVLGNPLLCDCRMQHEHIARVQSHVYWSHRQLTWIMIADICPPNPGNIIMCV